MKSAFMSFVAATLIALAGPVFADKTTGDVVDDNTINASVKAGLVGAKGLPSTDINVETYKGVVLLSGFVQTQAQKDQAGAVAKGVSNVKSVHNAISLHSETSMGTKLDDTVLTSKVKAALFDDKDVKSGQINVESRGGVVQLAGFVSGDKMKKRALEVASKVEGVKKVDDALYVKPAG